ncbi:MAG TPA: sensor histidine kinase, partial [Candidatus Olsenella avistercoris]|nr:sensor histidine kinase [Candidatus Olsenella avistercoris]
MVLLAVLAALWAGYARDLPADALAYGIIPADHVTCELFFSTDRSGLDALTLAVKTGPTPTGDWFFFEPGSDLISLWPAGATLLVVELLSLLGIFSDVRRIRRRLQPLNALALSAEALGSKDIMDASKIESLEQAIERASVDSPQVKTGVDDLASIEVALNGLLRQMQEAKLQQIRFVSDASHELRTPIAVIQGYVNMLDRWGKDDRAVLEESIAALKAEGAHMQELVEQLL